MVMVRRIVWVSLCVLACALGASPAAQADGLTCTPALTKLRYRPQIAYACTAPSALTSVTTSVVRLPTRTPVASFPGWSGLAATVDLPSLASGTEYRITATLTDGSGDSTRVRSYWTTLPPPAYPRISVEYLTAMDPLAVRDMLHRVDAANLVAVPSAARVIDVSTSPLDAAGLERALTGRQVAVVVGGDAGFAHPAWLGKALAWFASHGHGVVTAGQTHWSADADWPFDSAVGAGTAWDSSWGLYPVNDQITSDRIMGGTLRATSVVHHFITAGLSSFRVIGPGSGEAQPQFFGTQVLAMLKRAPSGFFNRWPQTLLAVRQVGPTRTVDLGYRPWTAAVAGGGFDPAVSPGGRLFARSLLWAANRIPPVNTRFVSKPSNPSAWATFLVRFAATDPDGGGWGVRFRYRLDSGRWHWASGSTAPFFCVGRGRSHTLQAFAVDSGGNRDPHTATYRFAVRADARC